MIFTTYDIIKTTVSLEVIYIFFKSKKSEDFLIRNLIIIDKDCWRSNFSKKATILEMHKFLNKYKLDLDSTPNIYDFHKILNNIIHDSKGIFLDRHYEEFDRALSHIYNLREKNLKVLK